MPRRCDGTYDLYRRTRVTGDHRSSVYLVWPGNDVTLSFVADSPYMDSVSGAATFHNCLHDIL